MISLPGAAENRNTHVQADALHALSLANVSIASGSQFSRLAALLGASPLRRRRRHCVVVAVVVVVAAVVAVVAGGDCVEGVVVVGCVIVVFVYRRWLLSPSLLWSLTRTHARRAGATVLVNPNYGFVENRSLVLHQCVVPW